MNSILIIGAGRSSGALIDYVLQQAKAKGWFVTVADIDPKRAAEKVNNHPNGRPAWLDVMKTNDRREMIGRSDVVVSILPAHLHLEVAHECVRLKKHLITSSSISKELYRLGDEARNRELMFMGEMGLDPGVEQMSSMKLIDELKEQGAKITSYRSFTGGLMSPESDDNPWNYKFTWSPRNVVLAGQGTAQYLQNGKIKFIPYNRLFQEYEILNVPGVGEFETFLDRDALLYRDIYGLKEVPNIVKGTLRRRGFCEAWNALIKIGLTDGDYPILEGDSLTYHSFMEAFLPSDITSGSVKERVAQMIGEEPNSPIMKKLEWLGLFRKKKINLPYATPALILEDLLVKKWKLKPGDRDTVYMYHEIEYILEGRARRRTATLALKGDSDRQSAMSKLIGLPMGIFLRLLMDGKITDQGLRIPVMREIYEPVLTELEGHGIQFSVQDVA